MFHLMTEEVPLIIHRPLKFSPPETLQLSGRCIYQTRQVSMRAHIRSLSFCTFMWVISLHVKKIGIPSQNRNILMVDRVAPSCSQRGMSVRVANHIFFYIQSPDLCFISLQEIEFWWFSIRLCISVSLLVKSSLHPNYVGDGTRVFKMDLRGVGCDTLDVIWLAVDREA